MRRWIFLAVLALASQVGWAQVMFEYGGLLNEVGKPGIRIPNVPLDGTPTSAPRQPVGDIAFICKGDIYTVTLDGKYIRRLTADGRNAFPLWSPDGRHIAFSKAGKAQSSVVWIGTSDGRFAKPLTSPQDFKAASPVTWLPDGKGLLVKVSWTGKDRPDNHWVVNLDRRGPHPLQAKWAKAGKNAGFHEDPFVPSPPATFSGSGESLMFLKNLQSDDPAHPMHSLYRMATNGSGIRRLDASKVDDMLCLRWNPRAGKVLSAECRPLDQDEVEYGIWLRDSEGKALGKLADTGPGCFNGMDWSPGGNLIIFQKTDSAYPGSPQPEAFSNLSDHSSIWIMKADGSGKYKYVDGACHPNWR